MSHLGPKVEKIGVIDLFKVKISSRSYYITIPKYLVDQYGLTSGHYLKIHIKEVRKPRFEEDEIRDKE